MRASTMIDLKNFPLNWFGGNMVFVGLEKLVLLAQLTEVAI